MQLIAGRIGTVNQAQIIFDHRLPDLDHSQRNDCDRGVIFSIIIPHDLIVLWK